MNPQQLKVAQQAQAGCLALIVQGDLAGLTCYTSKRHKTVYYPQAPPRTPATPDQAFFRALVSTGAATWRQMPPEIKQRWKTACQRAHLRIGPTALILAASMPGSTEKIRTIEAQTNVTLLDPQGNIYVGV